MLTIKTFTDPPGDKARLARQKEEEESEPLSPLDIGSSIGQEDKSGDDGKLRDEGAFFEKSPMDKGKNETDTDTSGKTGDDKSSKEQEPPAKNPSDDAGEKPQETPGPEGNTEDESK